MPGHGEKLERKKEAAISALLAEATVKAAAKKAKIGYRTLKEWLTDPSFQADYRAARRQLLDGTLLQLQRMATQAALTLWEKLKSDKDAIALKAALGILAQVTKLSDTLDLAEDIAQLRREMEEMKNAGHPEKRSGDAQATTDESAA